jgi:hypothetical protein
MTRPSPAPSPCGSTYLTAKGGVFACDKPPGHAPPHASAFKRGPVWTDDSATEGKGSDHDEPCRCVGYGDYTVGGVECAHCQTRKGSS